MRTKTKYLWDTDPNKPNEGKKWGCLVMNELGHVGWSVCHPNDTFSNKVARAIAINRMNRIPILRITASMVDETLHPTMDFSSRDLMSLPRKTRLALRRYALDFLEEEFPFRNSAFSGFTW